MTVARMHSQRTVKRGFEKPRYTRQRPIPRGGQPVVVPPVNPTVPGVITEIDPTALTVDSVDVVLIITGTGFAAGCVVSTGSVDFNTSRSSPTECTFVVPGPTISGTYQFFVKNNPTGTPADATGQAWSNTIDVPSE